MDQESDRKAIKSRSTPKDPLKWAWTPLWVFVLIGTLFFFYNSRLGAQLAVVFGIPLWLGNILEVGCALIVLVPAGFLFIILLIWIRRLLHQIESRIAIRSGSAFKRKLKLGVALFLLLVPLGFLLFFSYKDGHGAQFALVFGLPLWLGCLLDAVCQLFIFALIIILFAILLNAVKSFLLRFEGYDFSQARKSAKEEGTIVRLDLITIWFSGVGKGMQALQDVMNAARRRLEDLVGEPIEIRQPLRLMSFARRTEFDAYMLRLGLRVGALEGVYLLGKPRRIVICLEKFVHRLMDHHRLLRTLFAYCFLEQRLGFFPRPWLYMGIGNLVAHEKSADLHARLARKMSLAIAKGISLDKDGLFDPKLKALGRRFLRRNQPQDFVYVSRFVSQVHSVVVYLCETPRRQTFLGFLKDIKQKEPLEPVFEKHFGFGFGRLLEDWQTAVKARRSEEHFPPPPAIKEGLLKRILPF